MEKKRNGENPARDPRRQYEDTSRTAPPNRAFIPIVYLSDDEIEVINEKKPLNENEVKEVRLNEDVVICEVRNRKAPTLQRVTEDRSVFKKTNDSLLRKNEMNKLEAIKTIQDSTKTSQIISTLESKGIKVENIATSSVDQSASTPDLSGYKDSEDDVQVITPGTDDNKPDIKETAKIIASSSVIQSNSPPKMTGNINEDDPRIQKDSDIDLNECFKISILDCKGFIKEEKLDISFAEKPKIVDVYSLGDGSNRANWQPAGPAPSSNDAVSIEDVVEIYEEVASDEEDISDRALKIEKKSCNSSTQTDRDISPDSEQTDRPSKKGSQLATTNRYFLRKRSSRPSKKSPSNEVEKLCDKYCKKTISVITTAVNKKFDKLENVIRASSCTETANAAPRAKRGRNSGARPGRPRRSAFRK